jgi:methionyl-tRNA formyltransferase
MNDEKIKIVLFASKYVGKEVLDFLVKHYPNDIASIVVDAKDADMSEYLQNKIHAEKLKNLNTFVYDRQKEREFLEYLKIFQVDYFILAWWSYILKKEIISLPKFGVINFHPSFLPYNRGKHPNFWTIVEDTPFGVTLHFIDEGIDTGDIIFQKAIEKTWEDTGQTLYEKATEEIIKLFKDSYPCIREHNYKKIPQLKAEGTFHLAREIDKVCVIDLNAAYTAKELLNLIRARTFEGYPSCTFTDNGSTYEVRINIKKLHL